MLFLTPIRFRRKLRHVPIVAAALLAAVSPSMFSLTSVHAQAEKGVKQKLWKVPAEKRVSGEYIVVLKDNIDRKSIKQLAKDLVQRHKGQSRLVYEDAIKGFSASLTEEQALALSEDPRVDHVTEDFYMEVDGESQNTAAYNDVPRMWHLDRIDQQGRLNSNQPGPAVHDTNLFNYSNDGAGVHIYILDSGISTYLSEFEGRASNDANFTTENTSDDLWGHGTAVASLAGGRLCGVAKKARLHSVKVLNQFDRGDPNDGIATRGSWVIEGIDWTIQNHVKPAVANISIGYRDVGPVSNTSIGTAAAMVIENATKNLIASGVTVVVSAGNWNEDAGNWVPARIPAAVTVGASDEFDQHAIFNDTRNPGSNHGPSVDLYAPGLRVPGAARNYSGSSPIRYPVWYGTSFAAPQVAGAAALYLQSNPQASPRAVEAAIVGNATRSATVYYTRPGNLFGVIQNLPAGTPDRLLNTSFAADLARFWVPAQLPANAGAGRIASNGWSREATTAEHSQGFLQYGPYTTQVPVGANAAVWKLAVDVVNASDDDVVRLEVIDHTESNTAGGDVVLGSRIVKRSEFTQNFAQSTFSVGFELSNARKGHQIELRCWWYDTSYVRLDTVGVSAIEWNMTHPDIWHPIGRADGDAWSANMAQDVAGALNAGPYTTWLEPKQLDMSFELKIDSTAGSAADSIGELVVADYDRGLAGFDPLVTRRTLYRGDFNASNVYQRFTLPFEWGGHFLNRAELVTRYHDTSTLTQRSVIVSDSVR
jgi:hypothetical protein